MSLSKKIRRKYDSSFNEDVLKMVTAGSPIAEVSKAPGVSSLLRYGWHKATHSISTNSGKNAGQSSTFQEDAFEQVVRLKTELRRTGQERDILKKALGIFSRGT